MRWAATVLGCLLAIALQATWGPHLAVAGVAPDLPQVAVLVFALRRGPAQGGLAGLVAGLALDLLRGGRPGLFAAALGLTGWLTGEAACRVDTDRLPVRWLLATVGAAFGGFLVVAAWRALGHPVDLPGALGQVLAGAAYDGAAAAALYGLAGSAGGSARMPTRP